MGKNKADEELKKKKEAAEEPKNETSAKKGQEVTEGSEAKEAVKAAEAETTEEESKETQTPTEKDGDQDQEGAPSEDAASEEADQADAEDASGEEEQADDAEEKAAGEKKKLFPKREKKDKKDEKIEELTDRVARQMAEFENFRKRTEKEKSQMFETGAKSIIEKILPVIDNFERGLAAVPEEEKESPFVDGMDKIYKQLLTELENAGVKAIEAVGQEFDPELHNAVMQVESEEYESGTVAQELQKGYKYRDTVVRHSMVAVVQ